MATRGTSWTRLSRGKLAAVSALACCSFALLIWMKLRLVTGMPKSAYAQPDDRQPANPNGAPNGLQPGASNSNPNGTPINPQQKAPKPNAAKVYDDAMNGHWDDSASSSSK